MNEDTKKFMKGVITGLRHALIVISLKETI